MVPCLPAADQRDSVTVDLTTRDPLGWDSIYLVMGTKFFVSFSVAIVQNQADGIVESQIVMRDISQRKEVEEELIKSEERYKDLVNCSPDIVWRIDREGICTYISPSVKPIAGYEPEEIIGSSLLLSCYPWSQRSRQLKIQKRWLLNAVLKRSSSLTTRKRSPVGIVSSLNNSVIGS